MSFPEVIYRHGAQYCFNICRSRLVGLIITLILMQIFLFSFYLNGLHSQDATRSDSVNTILGNDSTFRHVVSTVKEPQQKVASVVKGPSADSPINKAKTFVSDVGKKALDKVMANKLPNVDLMNMVARKLSADSNNPVAKTGMNLIAHAINNMKNYQQSQQSKKVTIDEKNSSILSNRVENDFETEASSSTLRPLDSRVLEIISQLMRQRLQSTAEFNPQIVESAMKRLKNAITTQKIDPKNLLGLISKMRQLQSISNDSHSNGPGYELLSQLLSNNQLTSALTGLTTKPVSASQSKMIYDKYVKITNKKLPKLKSKMAYPYWSQSSKVVVDIGFRYFTEKVNACRPNATYLILSVSSAANTDERQAARETWIKDLHQLIGDQVDVAFVIGQTSNVTVQRTVLNESTIYNDLIETNVQEPIESAVYKTLAGLVWIENNCPNVEQILKVDDDVYVSAARMLRIFKEGKAKATLTGRMIDDMNPHTTSGKNSTGDYNFKSKLF